MALRAFKTVVTRVFELNQIQANIAAFFDQLRLTPFLTGNRITAQTIATAGTKVAHGLGKVPQGWFITYRSANSVIWQTAADDLYVTLQSSASCKVDLWIF